MYGKLSKFDFSRHSNIKYIKNTKIYLLIISADLKIKLNKEKQLRESTQRKMEECEKGKGSYKTHND